MQITIEYDDERLIIIERELFKTLLIQSFRYCLGRRTYAVSNCVEMLQAYWSELPQFLQKQVHGDIKHALECNNIGDECDKQEWLKLLKLEPKEKK